MRAYSFERLDVWKLSQVLAQKVYSLTQGFPAEERFGLTSQIRRAVVSISNNIAEGSGRSTGKEQARFTEIAFGSLLEVLNLLILAVSLGILQEEILTELRKLIEEIGNKLHHLKKRQLEH